MEEPLEAVEGPSPIFCPLQPIKVNEMPMVIRNVLIRCILISQAIKPGRWFHDPTGKYAKIIGNKASKEVKLSLNRTVNEIASALI